VLLGDRFLFFASLPLIVVVTSSIPPSGSRLGRASVTCVPTVSLFFYYLFLILVLVATPVVVVTMVVAGPIRENVVATERKNCSNRGLPTSLGVKLQRNQGQLILSTMVFGFGHIDFRTIFSRRRVTVALDFISISLLLFRPNCFHNFQSLLHTCLFLLWPVRPFH
jgi:hypothetical protein